MANAVIEYEAKILDVAPQELARIIIDKAGSKVTLTVKEIVSDDIGGAQETEITVSDFDTTNTLLGKLGYRAKAYQENQRQSFLLDGAQLEIDSWPHIPPYLEIEASGKAEVLRVAELLGYSEDQLTGKNTTKIYADYGIDLKSITDLRFTE
ncbi:adenylate cyclase [Salinactinospora qingdaonensis]|uniref:Adenylate cyclase, class 2 n=1 Tax=Salinactinospora qingdaonensis TaxID=702744 RepID=A0ABP7GKH0_9ACTN